MPTLVPAAVDPAVTAAVDLAVLAAVDPAVPAPVDPAVLCEESSETVLKSEPSEPSVNVLEPSPVASKESVDLGEPSPVASKESVLYPQKGVIGGGSRESPNAPQ